MFRRFGTFLGIALLIGALAMHVIVAVVFHFRWDSLAMATVFPVWLYAIAALGILLAARYFIRTRWIPALALVWILSLPFLADEAPGLKRYLFGYRPEPRLEADAIPAHTLRLVTVNCKNREIAPLQEVQSWKPDIVFLQEAPFDSQLKAAAKTLFGDDAQVLRHRECAIMARGRHLKMVPLQGPNGPGRPRGVVAQLELLDGRKINLVNVHLDSASLALSFWSRKTWQTHANNRRSRRETLAFISSHEKRLPPTNQAYTPTIVAGDFNAPAGDASIRMLENRFIDAYKTVGHGWCDTFPSGLPVHRIDQIWLDKRLEPLGLGVERISATDHRMVVCDFIFRP